MVKKEEKAGGFIVDENADTAVGYDGNGDYGKEENKEDK